MASASCAASITSTSRSSPTSHTLLSTSHVPPSRLNVPEVATRSITAALPFAGWSEQDDAAEHLAVLHLLERLLDVVQPDGLGDELLERQPSLQVQVDQHREVALGQAVAVPRGLQRPAAAEEADQRQLQPHVGGGYSD